MRIKFLLENQTEESFYRLPGMDELLDDLKARGIAWTKDASNGSHEEAYETNWKQNDLAVTDSQETACRLAGRSVCCIGFQPSHSSGYFEGVQLVLQSFEGLDADFFRSVLFRFQGRAVVIGRTPRLILRESTEEDFKIIYQISREEGNDRYVDGMTGDEAKEKEAYLAYVRKMYSFYGFGLWTVAQKVTGNVIGRCGLSLPSEECDCLRAAFEKNQRSPGTEEPCLELGYLIGKKYQRQGYGLEAGREALRYAFDRLGCQSVYAVIHNDNRPSAGLARKLGFSRLGEGEEKGNRLDLWRMRPHKKI